MQRQAYAVWQGPMQHGKGLISTFSGAIKQVPYSFSMRFADTPGTNPEELIAAAHASCFAMALSGALSEKGFEPVTLNVRATVNLEKVDTAWTVTSSHLELKGQIHNIAQEEFLKIAESAKTNCPISRLLKAEISLHAQLEETDTRPWAPPPPH